MIALLVPLSLSLGQGGIMRRIGYALAGAVFFLSASSGAQPPAPQTRSVQLSRVILNPTIPAANQHIKVGTICLFSGSPLNFGSAEHTLNYERVERLFAATMSEHHFNVIARSSNLFEGEGNSPGAEYLIGGTVHPQSVNICESISGQKGTFAISVEWQIYDRSRQQVVETVTTQGSGQVAGFQRDGLEVMFNRAFTASLAALIDQGVLQRHVGNPAP